jgi:hypothetical protein
LEKKMNRKLTAFASIALAAALVPSVAFAKRARCFTTDDGYFSCQFRATDRAGSFEIKGRATPAYSIVVDRPGFAFGYINFGNRGIPISGMFVRQRNDPGCWNNPEMNVKLCAW